MPAGPLWADADDEHMESGQPWDTADAGGWGKYNQAVADRTWPNSGPAGSAGDHGYQPYDLTKDDDQDLAPPTDQWDVPGDLTALLTPAQQATSDDKARQQRRQQQIQQQRQADAEALAIHERKQEQIEHESHNADIQSDAAKD